MIRFRRYAIDDPDITSFIIIFAADAMLIFAADFLLPFFYRITLCHFRAIDAFLLLSIFFFFR